MTLVVGLSFFVPEAFSFYRTRPCGPQSPTATGVHARTANRPQCGQMLSSECGLLLTALRQCRQVSGIPGSWVMGFQAVAPRSCYWPGLVDYPPRRVAVQG